MSNILDDETIMDMPNITCKTHIVWGNQDTTTPAKQAYQMKQLIQDSTLHFIENARHSPQFTHPQQTAQVIGDLLK